MTDKNPDPSSEPAPEPGAVEADEFSFTALSDLALNLRWTWNRDTDDLWATLHSGLWETTQNPWLILQTISKDKRHSVLADPVFRQHVSKLHEENRAAITGARWFQAAHPDAPLNCAAYFSMEYMLSESLPIYSGGLGNVAGDQLKAASNFGVPVVGVGLLYSQGYFRQEIDGHGNQQALYPFNSPGMLPVSPLRQPNKEWLRLRVPLAGSKLWLRVWEVRVGRLKLYLLDSNDPENSAPQRCITGELYGGGQELRLKQELILGIGGWRLLQELNLDPEVCHLNEGHAAFAVLDRARTYMERRQVSFAEALTATRPGNLFTTHTAVAAGFDRFPPELIARYLKEYAECELHISLSELMALGRAAGSDPGSDPAEPFNMAYLALRGCGAVNAVSRLHGAVSRRIFRPLFSRWPEAEVPVAHITNGVHMPTWSSAAATALWNEACAGECFQGTVAPEPVNPERFFRNLSDDRLWELRTNARMTLIHQARLRLFRQMHDQGEPAEVLDAVRDVFDPDALTLGFARRFATYKRPNLLLKDPERLARILTCNERPVQLMIAGKAHPNDLAGQALIRQWSEFIRRPDVRSRAVFLTDYDMLLSQQMVRGIDLWVNTPRRPWEASGTSGMKVLANGGLNVSELDGWWAEAYSPEIGWAFGDRREHGDDPEWDNVEAEALYSLLEGEIIPAFYDRNAQGIPVGWVKRMRESMIRLTLQFSAGRVIKEYAEKHYVSAAGAYRARSADGGKIGREVHEWQGKIAAHWEHLHFGALTINTGAAGHLFSVQVYLDELSPEAVRIELYADATENGPPERVTMTRKMALVGSVGGYLYSVAIPNQRPATDYTPRIVPYHEHAAVPLEVNRILWQR
jgi:starch phosphorylase